MNRGDVVPPYFSRPTTYPRYGDDSSPHTSGQLGSDYRSPNHQGYTYEEGNPSPSPGSRMFRLDHQPSTHPGYGDGSHFPTFRSGSFGSNQRQPLFQRNSTRTRVPIEYRPVEEGSVVRPSSQTSMPMDPPHLPRISPQVIIIGNNGASPRLPFSHRLTPRLHLYQETMNSYTPSETDNESKLTTEEQEHVLKKLKKEIYNPMPNKMMLPPRQVNLYYRELNRDPSYVNAVMDPKANHKDEDGKRCAVCLEDFEAREEVMLTPCNHMFHEDCIVPWVKGHGQCPVCRFDFCERVRENGSGLSRNGNSAMALPADNGLFEDELLSLIQVVNEAFPWGA